LIVLDASYPKRTIQIAPAGFGKTYAIVSHIKRSPGRSLVLTHTHAGVASISQKLKEHKVPNLSCSVETLSSVAQKYVHAFDPSFRNRNPRDNDYFAEVTAAAEKVFSSPIVQRVILNSYTCVYVDEYQDCTLTQHRMVVALARNLNLHLFGDPLQAIFDFQGERLVNFQDDLSEFEELTDLKTPWRWQKKDNNLALGEYLGELRSAILDGGKIVLSSRDDLGIHLVGLNPQRSILNDSDYLDKLSRLVNNAKGRAELESLLIVCPPSCRIADRVRIRDRIDPSGKRTVLLEAIDDKSFYKMASDCDALIGSSHNVETFVSAFRSSILEPVFSSTFLDEVFNERGLVKKRDPEKAKKSNQISTAIEAHLTARNASTLLELVSVLVEEYLPRPKRPELFISLRQSLLDAAVMNLTVVEAMINARNRVRRVGRKVEGRCIGSTLLTKGLEFDTVAVLDAHLYSCPKNFYVALTRACKRLVIFTNKTELVFAGRGR
jgi:DNA helicase-2/ATP-dependent DNA helicase PcrA